MGGIERAHRHCSHVALRRERRQAQRLAWTVRIGRRREPAELVVQQRLAIAPINVAVLPGEDCGVSPYVRASFAVAPERLREAGVRIMRACAALHRSKSTTRTIASQEGDQRAPNDEKSGWAVKFC